MSEYQIVLTGIAADVELEKVAARFAERFNVSVEKAAQMLSGNPLVIKRQLDQTSALRYQQALIAMGARAEIQLVTAEITAAAPPVPPAPPAEVGGEIDSPSGYRFRIDGRPDYAFLTVTIPANETLKVEASAMATMDTHLVMKTKLRGGFSRFVTGESIFMNEFRAERGSGEIGIAPGSPGDLRHVHLKDETIYLQNSAYVASTDGVEVTSKWQGLMKGFFSGESLFLIRAQGRGDLWFSSYGGIIEIDVQDDYVVDTGNIVAFTDGLEYSISRIGNYKSLFFSGEGLVCRFSGRGKVWIQTRKTAAFVAWAWPFRPVKAKG